MPSRNLHSTLKRSPAVSKWINKSILTAEREQIHPPSSLGVTQLPAFGNNKHCPKMTPQLRESYIRDFGWLKVQRAPTDWSAAGSTQNISYNQNHLSFVWKTIIRPDKPMLGSNIHIINILCSSQYLIVRNLIWTWSNLINHLVTETHVSSSKQIVYQCSIAWLIQLLLSQLEGGKAKGRSAPGWQIPSVCSTLIIYTAIFPAKWRRKEKKKKIKRPHASPMKAATHD